MPSINKGSYFCFGVPNLKIGVVQLKCAENAEKSDSHERLIVRIINIARIPNIV